MYVFQPIAEAEKLILFNVVVVTNKLNKLLLLFVAAALVAAIGKYTYLMRYEIYFH